MSKWVEAMPYRTNDNVVVKFLKENVFFRYDTPRVIISDQQIHSYNCTFEALLHTYGDVHKVLATYHSQTNG